MSENEQTIDARQSAETLAAMSKLEAEAEGLAHRLHGLLNEYADETREAGGAWSDLLLGIQGQRPDLPLDAAMSTATLATREMMVCVLASLAGEVIGYTAGGRGEVGQAMLERAREYLIRGVRSGQGLRKKSAKGSAVSSDEGRA